MKEDTRDLLENFIQNFRDEIDLKKKTNFSEEEQLQEISNIIFSFIKYHSTLSFGDSKFVNSISGPSSFLEIKEVDDCFYVIKELEIILEELGIIFKKHKFNCSLPVISARNNSVPGVIYGRGNCLFTVSKLERKNSCLLKIECLRENQLVKVIDGNIHNLSIVFWNGKGMSRSVFKIKEEENIFPTNGEIIELDLISINERNPYKVSGEFYRSLNDSLILDKITSIVRN